MRPSIDFNCDVGESFGPWRMGQDDALLPFASSANIACGMHAGDPMVIQHTIGLCQQHGVAIGAHPGLPDLQGFGRRTLHMSATEIHAFVLYQVSALAGMARASGAEVQHVKPHGALYHMANEQAEVAAAITDAIRDVSPTLKVYAQAQSRFAQIAQQRGLCVIEEAFAERRYEADGRLTPRDHPDAVIHDVDLAAQQVGQLLVGDGLLARTGERLRLRADTICLHGDRPDALEFARHLRQAIEAAGWRVAAP